MHLVFGYLRYVDRLPALARAHKLERRVALVLAAYAIDEVGRSWDADPAFDALAVLLEPLRATRFEVIEGNGKRTTFAQMSEMRARFPSTEDPFLALVAYRHDTVVAVVQLDAWTQVGGPPPYSDSWTLSVHVRELEPVRSQRELQKLAAARGFELSVSQFEATPVAAWRRYWPFASARKR